MDDSFDKPYSPRQALEQAEAVLDSDPEQARLLLYRLAHNHYADRDPLFNDWKRARELARQLAFGVVNQPEALAQTYSIISRLDLRLGDHRGAFLTSMYAFQQQTLAFNQLKEAWFTMPDDEVNNRLEGMRRWSDLEGQRHRQGLTEGEAVEQHKLKKQMLEVPGSTSLMVALFDDPQFPAEPAAHAQAVRNFVAGSEVSSIFGAANHIARSLDAVKLTTTDHRLLDSMSLVLLSVGPIPVREGSLGWSASARDIAEGMSHLYWKLAVKSALTPRLASKYVKLANRADRLYRQLMRPSQRMSDLAHRSTNLCMADLLDERKQLI